MIPVLISMTAGLLGIVMCFYLGELVLRRLEVPDSPEALASLANRSGSRLAGDSDITKGATDL